MRVRVCRFCCYVVMYQPDAGEWRAGKIEGVGKFKWANGDEYEGNCSGKLFGNLMCLLLLLFFFTLSVL